MLTVSGTRTDFDDDIGGLEVGLVDNGVADARVLEDVLAKVLVEAEDVCVGRALGGRFAVVGAAAGPSPLRFGGLGHYVALRWARAKGELVFSGQHHNTKKHQ